MNFISEFSCDENNKISSEFQRAQGKHYLDHAGATLYSERQIDDACDLFKNGLFLNPHTSKETEDIIDQVRYKILRHFNTDPSEYAVVFTSGATASLKIVAECFDFGTKGCFAYCQENHTSILGMRQIVRTENVYVLQRDHLLENVMDEESISECNRLENGNEDDTGKISNSLVTYSAQCNFSGYKYPTGLTKTIQKSGLKNFGKKLKGTEECKKNPKSCKWFVCLDAASYASTNFLDLHNSQPDFACISFYKIFGYPTGLGALLVSNRGQNVLQKKYFGGGTVKIAMSAEDFHEKRDCFYERFEDGTLSFLSIISLLSSFKTIERLILSHRENSNGSIMERISRHVYNLAKYCYNSLRALSHNNGSPVIKFYKHTNFQRIEEQGGICTFNILHDDGSFIGFAEVACLATIYNIILRTGCFCNPGACQVLLKLEDEELRRHYKSGHICGDYNDLIDNIPTGAVRVSFGYMTTKVDIDALIHMIKDCYLTKETAAKRLEIIENVIIPKNLIHVPERIKQKTKSKLRLREICVYPIKSCGAFRVGSKWELTDQGLKYDRNWMIVNGNGVAATQKSDSRLCMISPLIDLEKRVMTLRFPEKSSINVPLESVNGDSITSSLCQSKVCGDLVEGIDCGDQVADWLCECLDTPGLRLIQQREDIERRSRSGKIKDINLSNQAQFLLINYTSVKWLVSKVEKWNEIADAKKYDELIDGVVNRFRGNLIIESLEALEEQNYESFQVGNIVFSIDGFCTRCQMICIDQATGQKTSEPLKTIAKEFEGKIRFGIYLSQIIRNEENVNRRYLSCCDNVIVEK